MNIYYYFLYFVIYSILGWVAEMIYCKLLGGKFTNRGFLNGPYCPIYGFGALLVLLLLKNFTYSPILVFFLAMFFTSLLEYITSFLMEKIFNAKWWDYSNLKFNLNGRICLLNSTEFAVLGLVLTYFIHPQVKNMVNLMPINIVPTISYLLLLVLCVDLAITLYTFFNLKEKLKEIYAITNEIIKSREDSTNNPEITKRLESVKNNIILKTSAMHKRLLQAFPNIEFKKQNVQLTEIKEKINERINMKRKQKLEKKNQKNNV